MFETWGGVIFRLPAFIFYMYLLPFFGGVLYKESFEEIYIYLRSVF